MVLTDLIFRGFGDFCQLLETTFAKPSEETKTHKEVISSLKKAFFCLMVENDISQQLALKAAMRFEQEFLAELEMKTSLTFKLNYESAKKKLNQILLDIFSPCYKTQTKVQQTMFHFRSLKTTTNMYHRSSSSDKRPCKVFLVGLQGVGKTTFASKLARLYQRRNYHAGLIGVDTVRFGANDQIRQNATASHVDFFVSDDLAQTPCQIAIDGLRAFGALEEENFTGGGASNKTYEVVVIDPFGCSTNEPARFQTLLEITRTIRPDRI